MASLDNLEGDLAEGAGILILAVIALLIWGVYSGFKNGIPLLAAIKKILDFLLTKSAGILTGVEDLLFKARDGLNAQGWAAPTSGPDMVATGITSDQVNPAAYTETPIPNLGGY